MDGQLKMKKRIIRRRIRTVKNEEENYKEENTYRLFILIVLFEKK